MKKRTLDEHLARKAPHLRTALDAARDTVGFIADIDKRQEVEEWLLSVIHAERTTARGGYVGGYLRKIHDHLDAPKVRNEPTAKHAIYAIRSALHRDGWRIWKEAYLTETSPGLV